ncbi:MAG: hypothetical protein ACRCZZ_09130 [Phocaeicola sp.]
MKYRHLILFFTAVIAIFSACSSPDESYYRLFNGKLNRDFVNQLTGFVEQKSNLLERHAISEEAYISLTTAKASALSISQRAKLRSLRMDIPSPNTQTLLQKVIPLADLGDYMDNIYEGRISGFVNVAADVKELRTMREVYWGLRLDYVDSKFKEYGAGYGVIRFYSADIDFIVIPFSPEMDGSTVAEWPFTGGGFTPSTLGKGGYPLYKFSTGYYMPAEGAEIYECTPGGNEILRSVFRGGKWVTSEGEIVSTRSNHAVKEVHTRLVNYKGYSLYLRGETQEGVHLFTSDPVVAKELGMAVYEKGEYFLIAPANSIVELD